MVWPGWGSRWATGHTKDVRLADGTPSVREKIEVVLRDDALFAAEAVIPPKLPGSVGRKRTYPDFVWTMWPELRPIFGSHSAIERELDRGGWWSHIRRHLHRDSVPIFRCCR